MGGNGGVRDEVNQDCDANRSNGRKKEWLQGEGEVCEDGRGVRHYADFFLPTCSTNTFFYTRVPPLAGGQSCRSRSCSGGGGQRKRNLGIRSIIDGGLLIALKESELEKRGVPQEGSKTAVFQNHVVEYSTVTASSLAPT